MANRKTLNVSESGFYIVPKYSKNVKNGFLTASDDNGKVEWKSFNNSISLSDLLEINSEKCPCDGETLIYNSKTKTFDYKKIKIIDLDIDSSKLNVNDTLIWDGKSWKTINIINTGIKNLNGLTSAVQNYKTGIAGDDFNIVSKQSSHVFNIPNVSKHSRGLLTPEIYQKFNDKLDRYLDPGFIFIGNEISKPMPRKIYGDVTMDNTGKIVLSNTDVIPGNYSNCEFEVNSKGLITKIQSIEAPTFIKSFNGSISDSHFLVLGKKGNNVNIKTFENKTTINIPEASSTSSGILTSDDYNRFENKINNYLENNHFLIGNQNSKPTPVKISGDLTIDNSGKSSLKENPNIIPGDYINCNLSVNSKGLITKIENNIPFVGVTVINGSSSAQHFIRSGKEGNSVNVKTIDNVTSINIPNVTSKSEGILSINDYNNFNNKLDNILGKNCIFIGNDKSIPVAVELFGDISLNNGEVTLLNTDVIPGKYGNYNKTTNIIVNSQGRVTSIKDIDNEPVFFEITNEDSTNISMKKDHALNGEKLVMNVPSSSRNSRGLLQANDFIRFDEKLSDFLPYKRIFIGDIDSKTTYHNPDFSDILVNENKGLEIKSNGVIPGSYIFPTIEVNEKGLITNVSKFSMNDIKEGSLIYKNSDFISGNDSFRINSDTLFCSNLNTKTLSTNFIKSNEFSLESESVFFNSKLSILIQNNNTTLTLKDQEIIIQNDNTNLKLLNNCISLNTSKLTADCSELIINSKSFDIICDQIKIDSKFITTNNVITSSIKTSKMMTNLIESDNLLIDCDEFNVNVDSSNSVSLNKKGVTLKTQNIYIQAENHFSLNVDKIDIFSKEFKIKSPLLELNDIRSSNILTSNIDTLNLRVGSIKSNLLMLNATLFDIHSNLILSGDVNINSVNFDIVTSDLMLDSKNLSVNIDDIDIQSNKINIKCVEIDINATMIVNDIKSSNIETSNLKLNSILSESLLLSSNTLNINSNLSLEGNVEIDSDIFDVITSNLDITSDNMTIKSSVVIDSKEFTLKSSSVEINKLILSDENISNGSFMEIVETNSKYKTSWRKLSRENAILYTKNGVITESSIDIDSNSIKLNEIRSNNYLNFNSKILNIVTNSFKVDSTEFKIKNKETSFESGSILFDNKNIVCISDSIHIAGRDNTLGSVLIKSGDNNSVRGSKIELHSDGNLVLESGSVDQGVCPYVLIRAASDSGNKFVKKSGSVIIQSGNSTNTASAGDITIRAGNSSGSGKNGDIILETFDNGSGNSGNIILIESNNQTKLPSTSILPSVGDKLVIKSIKKIANFNSIELGYEQHNFISLTNINEIIIEKGENIIDLSSLKILNSNGINVDKTYLKFNKSVIKVNVNVFTGNNNVIELFNKSGNISGKYMNSLSCIVNEFEIAIKISSSESNKIQPGFFNISLG